MMPRPEITAEDASAQRCAGRCARPPRRGLRRAGAVLAFVATIALADRGRAQVQSPVHEWSGDGLRLELAPLTADQVRAFFIGRGFSAADADFIARQGCVFRASIGSDFDGRDSPPVSVSLDRWRVMANGRETAPMTREKWAETWKRRGTAEPVRMAFHWALFPTRQEFGPTDYNWGMITFALPPESRFDLDMRWRTGSSAHDARLEGLECGR